MGDAWAIDNKPEIQADFKQSLANDYRWRATPSSDVFSFNAGGGRRSVVKAVALEERFLVHPDDLTRRGEGSECTPCCRDHDLRAIGASLAG